MTAQRAKRRAPPTPPGLEPLSPEQVQAARALLRSWREAEGEDAEEQRETGEYLMRALDEYRPPGCKLFE